MYGVINGALNGVFLGGRFESRPLYLVLDKRGREELAESLGAALGCDVDDVEAACCRVVGQELGRIGDPYKPLELERFKWTVRGQKSRPPFTALLFALSHAAELMVSDGQFTSSNYYRRLAGLLDFDWQKLSLHGKATEQFWKSLNKWLADTDFQNGRPTARAANSWKYVGLAMSQAIVREEDRQRFHDLFEKYGFTGTDVITEEEIAQYIANWICTARPTHQLKAAWAKAELRPRICEAAIAELEEWAEQDRSRVPGGATASKLSIAASFRHDVLSRSIALWIGREASMPDTGVSPADDADSLILGNTTFGGFATVEPRARVDMSKAMIGGLDLRADSGQSYSWSARAVIPLSRSEKGNYWTEVNRVTMGLEHLVLARSESKVRDGVEAVLEQAAEPGYSLSTPQSLPGLPAGWLLYERVRISRAIEGLEGYQAALSPVGTTSGLQLEGGLKIGRSIWHEQRPPRAVLDTRQSGTTLVAWEGTSPDGDEMCDVGSDTGQAVLDFSGHVPPSGNVYIEGQVAGTVVGTATLLLRSASRPRPLDRQSRGLLSYTGVLECGPLSAAPNGVRGLVALPSTLALTDLSTLSNFTELGQSSSSGENPAEGEPTEASTGPAFSLANMSIREVMALPCAVRGFHRYVFETLPPGFPKYAPVNKECGDCGISLLHRRTRSASPTTRLAKPSRPVPLTRPSTVDLELNLPVDLWLDASCFWGYGSAASFEALVSAEGLDPWRAAEVLKHLSWLGHLDVQQGSRWRPRSWSIAPPSLSFVGPGSSVLAGFRNDKLVDDITSLATCAGGRVQVDSLPGQPRTIRVTGLDPEAARSAFDVAYDPHGRAVEIIADPATRLASFCVAGAELSSYLQPVTLAWAGELHRFDVGQSRWRRVEESGQPGAYKFTYAGTQYAFRAPSGRAYAGSYEVVKLAAARLEQATLHSYSATDCRFSSVLGCEPIGLLSRALVACSGTLPKVENGLSQYEQVPEIIAAAILDYLYIGDLPS